MPDSSSSVTLQLIVLTRTGNWLKSTGRYRKALLTEWVNLQPGHGTTMEVTDDKGALVRFTGDADGLRKVREWAAAHSGSVRVLP